MSRLYFGSKSRMLEVLKKEFPEHKLISVDNTENQIKSFSKFFDNDKIFIHSNPNIDELKLIQNQIQNNSGIHFLFYDEESFDGRNSLIQKIKKENCIFDVSYPVLGDKSSFQRLVLNYVKSFKATIDFNVFDWLYLNCPLIRLKSKTTKKEKVCYDIDILFRELDKIISIKNNIEINDFDNSLFVSDGDIFELIDSIISGNKNKSFEIFQKLSITMGDQSILMIMIYQLIFLIQLSGLRNKYSYNINKIIEELELRDLLGKYFDENWNKTQFNIKSQNPLRIKIEMNKPNYDVGKLSKLLNFVVDCVKDLRNNGLVEQSIFIMMNKAMG